MNQDNAIAAYHESGHIVMAYFFGFACTRVNIASSDPDGETAMHWGKFLVPVAGIIHYDEDPDMCADMTRNIPEPALANLASQLAIIYVAGSVAERIYLNLQQPDNPSADEFLLLGKDSSFLNSIQALLTKISPNLPPTYTQELIRRWYAILRNKFWPAIDGLAQEILSSPTFSLDRSAIEKCLSRYKSILAQELR